MFGLEYDTSKTGLNAVLRGWQLTAMEVVWGSPDGAKSRVVHEKVNRMLDGETISRASVINFLEAMREREVLSGEEATGKGGYHWVYYPKLDEVGFRKYVVEKMIKSLMENFPEATREAIRSLRG
jgi:hypothetical protein